MTYLFIFITPLLNFLLFEAFFFRADLFYAALIISNLLILVAVRRITGKKITSGEFWSFSILPLLFSSSLGIYSLLVVSHVIIQLLFVLNLGFTFFYLKNIYRGEQPDFLENISSYGNLLTVFFIFAGIYGLEEFQGWPIWILILGLAALLVIVVYQILWANRIKAQNILAYIFLITLLLVQLAWAIYYLPFNYNTLGLIATIFFYLIIGFIKLSLADKLTRRNLKLYLGSGIVFLLLVFLTAKWL